MEIGKLHSFNTIAPIVLGDRYDNVKLVSSGLGNRFDDRIMVDIQTKNIQVANVNGVPADDVSTMLCHLFLNENNEELVLADNWIDHNTVSTGSKINFNIIISDIRLEDKSVILQTLDSMGYKVITQRTTQLT